MEVEIVLKQDQHTGRRTRGVVHEILTKSASHPHGIKVRLEDGRVGRVAGIPLPDRSGGDGTHPEQAGSSSPAGAREQRTSYK